MNVPSATSIIALVDMSIPASRKQYISMVYSSGGKPWGHDSARVLGEGKCLEGKCLEAR
jgi:hypothetical protein